MAPDASEALEGTQFIAYIYNGFYKYNITTFLLFIRD